MLLDHVEVVEQPLAGRPHVHLALRSFRQPDVDVVQDPAGLVQPGKESGVPPPLAAGSQALSLGHRAGALGEVLGAQQLAPDRSGENLLGAFPAAGEETGDDEWGAYSGDERTSDGIRREVGSTGRSVIPAVTR